MRLGGFAPSIELKVSLIVAALVVAAVGAVGAWTSSEFGRALTDGELRELDAVAGSTRLRAIAQVEAVQAFVEPFARRPAVREALARPARAGDAELEALLRDALAGQPSIRGLRVYAPDGRPRVIVSVASPRPLPTAGRAAAPASNLADRLQRLAGAPPGAVAVGLTEPEPGQLGHTLLVGALVAVRDENRRPAGFVEATFDLADNLARARESAVTRLGTDRVDLLAIAPSGASVGVLGFAMPVSAWTAADLDELRALARRSAAVRSGFAPEVAALDAAFGADGRAALLAGARLLELGDAGGNETLAIALAAPSDVLLAGYLDSRRRNLWFIACVLVIAAGVVALYARRLTRPLRQLAATVDAFAAGTSVERLPSPGERRDEIGRLATAVHRMMEQVEERAGRLTREVRERQEAERREREGRRVLAESEIRYRRLYEGIAAGVLTAGPDGRLRAANPALLRMLGYASEAELLAIDFGDSVYAGPGTFDALLARCRTHGELANLEIRLHARGGRTLVGLSTWSATWDERGEIAGFDATVLDVTDSRLAESRRRAFELRFRRLFDSNSVGVMLGNLHRKSMDDANDYLLELLGVRASELPLALAAFTPEEFVPADRRIGAELLENGRVQPFQKEYLHRDGSRVPVLVSAAMVDPVQGDFVGVVIDRSAEVAASRRLAETTAFYELLLDSVPTRMACVDADERLVYANRAYRDWFDAGEPPVGRTIRELVGAERYAKVAPEIRRALAGATVSFTTLIRREGREYVFDMTYVPQRDARGRVTGFLSFVHDVSHAAEGPAAEARSA